MAERVHSPLRIAVGLALTGCAFVAAGRRTHRGPLLPISAVEPSSGERLAASPPQATTPTSAATSTATTPPEPTAPPEAPGEAGNVSNTVTAPAEPAPSEALGATAPMPAAPTRRPGSGPSEKAVAFDAVMSRVTTLIDAASRSGVQTHVPGGTRTDMQMDGPHTELSPSAPSATVATLPRPDDASQPQPELTAQNDLFDARPDDFTEEIAHKAALFLAENALAAGGVGAATGRWRPPRAENPIDRMSIEDTALALRRIGLGDDIVDPVAEGLRQGRDLDSVLIAEFGRLAPAPPPPRRAGSLLVVVGAGDEARRLAVALADEIESDPDDVAVASPDGPAPAGLTNGRFVRTAVEAAERAPGWRRSRPAVVVAVDAPVTATTRSWARHLIDSLRPTAVWGIVDSGCKTEDIASWASDLGGFDAVALEKLDTTVSPGAALGAAIPVARLDGRPATPECWRNVVIGALRAMDAGSDGAISSGAISSGAISSGAISSGAISSGAISDGAISSGAVSFDSVDLADLPQPGRRGP